MVHKKPVRLPGLILTLLVMAGPAQAEEKTFGPFILETPAGWSAHYDRETPTLSLAKDGQNARLTISLQPLTEGQWSGMINEMTNNPKPGVGRPQLTSETSFQVTFTEAASGQPGLERYQLVEGGSKMVRQVVIGSSPELERTLHSFKYELPAQAHDE